MSTIIDFDQFGGYRLEQPTLKKMQANTFLAINALIGHFGIADVGHFIISGCRIEGANITAGIVYIDGTVCEFEQTAGTLATKIKKVETLESLEFFNGTTPTVFRKYTAVVDAAGTALSAFVRVPSPFDLPENMLTYLHQGTYILGAFTFNALVTIPFTDVGTDDYKVIGSIVGDPTTFFLDAGANWNVKSKTSNSIVVAFTTTNENAVQNLKFDYILIPNNN